eukprot:UN09832
MCIILNLFRILAARPNLKLLNRKLCYEWCEFRQRCKTSLSKIPLESDFHVVCLLKQFLTFHNFEI